MSTLQLSLLGTFQAAFQNAPLTQFRSDKIRALLAYLAVESNHPHRREHLAVLLWPESAHAMRNLRKSLHRLRQTVDSHQAGLSDKLLVVTRQTVTLQQTSITLDIAQFQQPLSQVNTHSHHALAGCPPCLEKLEKAVTYYRGEFLSGLSLSDSDGFEEWLLFKRENLHQKALTALHQLAATHQQQGAFEKTQQYATRQIELEAWHEGAYRQLMDALARQGKRAEALAHYETCRRVLAQELGVTPSQETTLLYNQIYQEQLPTRDVHQSHSVHHHFPPQINRFVGRDSELNVVIQHVLDPECRLLTLLGPGGMGKTRLSVQAVQQAAAKHSLALDTTFPDGCYFVPLADASNLDLLIASLAKALGITFQATQAPKQQLLNALQEKKALLVLDNFEQLVETAEFILQILNSAPHIQLFLTSRAALNLQAEWCFPLEGLSYPTSAETNPTQPSDAANLFVQSARRAQPHFQPNVTEQAAIIRICQLTQGMPLALQIAAAWTRMADCTTIADEIERSLDFLATTARDMPPRHRSMRAIFDQSWKTLSTTEQQRLSQISIFAGGFDLKAALFIMQTSIMALSSLLDKCLLRHNAKGRYEIHELLRQFAAEKLALGDEKIAQQAHQQHSRFYLHLIAEEYGGFTSSAPTSNRYLVTQMEIDNIRKAWDWAVSHGQWQLIAESVDGLSQYYQSQGLLQEGMAFFGNAAIQIKSAIEASDTSNNTATIDILNQLRLHQTNIQLAQSQFPSASQLSKHIIESSRLSGNKKQLTIALARNGHAWWRQGDYEKAKSRLMKSLALAKQLNIPEQSAYALRCLGNIAIGQQEEEKAHRFLQEAIILYEKIDDPLELANTLSNFGSSNVLSGKLEMAQIYFQRSVALHQRLNNPAGILEPLTNLCYVAIAQQDEEAAEKYKKQLLIFTKKYKAKWLWGRQAAYLGGITLRQGNFLAALEYYRTSLRVTSDLSNKMAVLYGFSAILASFGNLTAAARVFFITDPAQMYNPFSIKFYLELLHNLRKGLSVEAWQAAQAKGITLTLDEQLAYALTHIERWEAQEKITSAP